jgi:hypothetical protein
MRINDFLTEDLTDPDSEKVPNIVLQIRKSMDTGGNRALTFRDGSSQVVPISAMISFMNKYESLKPIDRETMQTQAVQSPESFMDVLKNFNGRIAPKSIY